MGKVNKRQSLKHSNHHDNPKRAKKAIARRQHSQNVTNNAGTKVSQESRQTKLKPRNTNGIQQVKSKAPFSKQDRVLLVGEGDFSFALSLAQYHKVGMVVATCFDSKDVLKQKYPQVTRTIQTLCGGEGTLDGAADEREFPYEDVDGEEETWNGFSPVIESEDANDTDITTNNTAKSSRTTILYDIDATKLSSTHKKALKGHGPFTKIVFNFPHVGGLSTDVNRQVRANQQLLVDFFKTAKPLLARKSAPAKSTPPDEDEDYDEDIEYNSDTAIQQEEHLKHGKILVTLFEGEPYTLWNVRDLARHSELKVLESFKFPWSAYPGYQHARTIGDITSGKDRSSECKRKGAWRGEERDARCYVLALKDDEDGRPTPGSRKRKKDAEDKD